MTRIENTVFISYRRTNIPWALAVYQNLSYNGYDVFLDFSGLGSGDFESIILSNILARAHFIVLLTPSALDRCSETGDWLRREIETALEAKRNVIPLMLEGFDFKTPEIAVKLNGNMALLKSYNGIHISADYFEAAMDRLRKQFLCIPLEAVLHPTSSAVRQVTEEEQRAAAAQPAVEERELTAQEYFERGFNTKSLDQQVRFFNEAIRLKPDYVEAINRRGRAREEQGDFVGAREDYDQAIRLKPDYVAALNNRAGMYLKQGDLANARRDYDAAIASIPHERSGLVDTAAYSVSFNGRLHTRFLSGDLAGGLDDLEQSRRLDKALLEQWEARERQFFEDQIEFQKTQRSYLKRLMEDAARGDVRAAEMIPKVKKLIDPRYDEVIVQHSKKSRWWRLS